MSVYAWSIFIFNEELKLFKSSFKPKKPNEWDKEPNTWLNTTQLNSILEQLQNKYNVDIICYVDSNLKFRNAKQVQKFIIENNWQPINMNQDEIDIVLFKNNREIIKGIICK